MEKKSKKSIIIGITGLLLVTLTLLGLTYAYYRTRIIGNEAETSVSVTSQKLEVTYQNESALVNVTGLEPGGNAIVKTFEVKNTGNATATYSVWLEDMTNTFERNQDLQYALTKNGESVTGTLDHIAAGTHQILIPSVSIDAEATDSYTLTINYKNEETIDQSEDMGSTLSFKINIQEETVTWENASEGTLLYAMKNASDAGTTLKTLEDDYGISNYYNGAVANNYVNYSGMCWRIMRVQGDGTIKMALMFNDVCENFESADASLKDLYQIFPYTTINVETIKYEETEIPGVITSWANTNNIDTSKLVETEWCNDASLYDMYETTEYNGDLYEFWYLGFIERNQTRNYTLKCNMKGLNNSTATRVTKNIAIMSADEYELAGSYLIDHDLGPGAGRGYLDWYMTLGFKVDTNGTMTDTEFFYNDYGSIVYGTGTSASYMVRPVIAVRSDVTITDGDDGTQNNPYVIG